MKYISLALSIIILLITLSHHQTAKKFAAEKENTLICMRHVSATAAFSGGKWHRDIADQRFNNCMETL